MKCDIKLFYYRRKPHNYFGLHSSTWHFWMEEMQQRSTIYYSMNWYSWYWDIPRDNVVLLFLLDLCNCVDISSNFLILVILKAFPVSKATGSTMLLGIHISQSFGRQLSKAAQYSISVLMLRFLAGSAIVTQYSIYPCFYYLITNWCINSLHVQTKCLSSTSLIFITY